MILVFIQIALGGLLTFDYISWIPHAITGFIVLALAIVTLIVAQTSKPPFKPLQGLSIGLVLAIVVQIILGFLTLNTGNLAVAWVHLLVAVGIYGMVVSGTFMSMRLNYIPENSPLPELDPRSSASTTTPLLSVLSYRQSFAEPDRPVYVWRPHLRASRRYAPLSLQYSWSQIQPRAGL